MESTALRLVQRADIVDFMTYEDTRDRTRPVALAAKERRRVRLGEHLTFAFENHETLRYQIQEVMRVERLVREADVLAEIDNYNRLLGEPGDLGCVLMIGIADAVERRTLLEQWRQRLLVEHLYVRLGDGSVVRPQFDESQIGDDRLSAVQFLRFPVRGRPPAAIGVDQAASAPLLESEVQLTADQVAALADDLSRTRP